MEEGERGRPRRGRAVETVGGATLHVLGSSCSIPRPRRAQSSYLLEAPGGALVFDMGTGSFANLIALMPAERVDAIVISHMHADHFIDLLPLRYALKYGPRESERRMPLFLPPDGERVLRHIADGFARERGCFLDDVFEIAEYDPATPLERAGASIRFAPMDHFIPSYASRVSVDGSVFVYSGDSASCDALVTVARDADVFVCEATLSRDEETQSPCGHLSARQAGDVAARAAVRRLVISHYPASADPLALRGDAALAFAGQIDVADDGDRIAIPSKSPLRV